VKGKGPLLMLESRLNSSMLRPQKPLDRQIVVARIVLVAVPSDGTGRKYDGAVR
jgi:hypothetical protein